MSAHPVSTSQTSKSLSLFHWRQTQPRETAWAWQLRAELEGQLAPLGHSVRGQNRAIGAGFLVATENRKNRNVKLTLMHFL